MGWHSLCPPAPHMYKIAVPLKRPRIILYITSHALRTAFCGVFHHRPSRTPPKAPKPALALQRSAPLSRCHTTGLVAASGD